MISVSEILSYLHCPWKYYTAYIIKRRMMPGANAYLGSVVHKIHKELVNTANKLKENGSSNEFISKALKVKTEKLIKGNQITSNSLKNQIKKMSRIISKCIERDAQIFSELKVKSKRMGIMGIVDGVEISNDSIVPIEIKTGKRNGISKFDKLQLSAYALILEDIFKKKVEKGVLLYMESEKIFSVKIGANEKMKVLEIRDAILELRKHMKLPKVEKERCRKCYFRKICLNS